MKPPCDDQEEHESLNNSFERKAQVGLDGGKLFSRTNVLDTLNRADEPLDIGSGIG